MKTPPTDPSPSPQQEPEWGPGAGAPGRVCGQGTYRVAAAVSAATLRTAGTTVVGERASRRWPPGGCVGLPHHGTSPRPLLAAALLLLHLGSGARLFLRTLHPKPVFPQRKWSGGPHVARAAHGARGGSALSVTPGHSASASVEWFLFTFPKQRRRIRLFRCRVVITFLTIN